MRDPVAFIVAFLVGTGLLLGIVAFIVRRLKGDETEKEEEKPKVVVLTCPCKMPATRPISRTRTQSVFGKFFYGQYVPDSAPLALCDIHGRSWDAMLRNRRITVIASRRAECEEKIATDMAAIETETLMEELIESLTTAQKRIVKRTAAGIPAVPMFVVDKNGKQDNSEVS